MDGITIRLTEEEARVLTDVLGDVRGAGPKRAACDAVYTRLQEALAAEADAQ